jgi:putative transcriptional regulator
MTWQLYRGKVLVATPTLDDDQFFGNTVFYIYEEKQEQVFGVVLNKVTKLKINDAVKLTGHPMHQSDIVVDQPIFAGGPVNQETLVLLHTNEWQSTNTAQLPHDLAISSDKLMLEKVLTGNCPRDYKMIAGVSTWHPRQLAMEIHRKSWLVIDNPKPKLFWACEGRAGWMDAVKMASAEAVDRFL